MSITFLRSSKDFIFLFNIKLTKVVDYHNKYFFLKKRSVLFRVQQNGNGETLKFDDRRSSVDSFVSARTDVSYIFCISSHNNCNICIYIY